MVVALLIALVGQGWNVLGGYGGQYSFGHAAFFGTGAYVTAILQVRYGVNAWAGLAHRHRGRRAGRRLHRRAELPLRPARLLLRAGHARLRRGAAHHRERRADHRRRRRHAGQARPALGSVPVPEPRAVLLDHPRLRRGLAADREAARRQPLRRLPGGGARERGRRQGGRHRRGARQARRDDAVGRDHGGGRLLLRAVFPVPRCRHRLRHLDLGRGAARADHRRHRHGLRPAARRAGGAHARRSRPSWSPATRPGSIS